MTSFHLVLDIFLGILFSRIIYVLSETETTIISNLHEAQIEQCFLCISTFCLSLCPFE
jgi:hypothetical protein